jgi:ubiquinone/menaquinone biosynthesis C-methylase UbiE
MKAHSEVETLFNAKAKSWNRKYQPGGPLVFRAAMFLELIETFLSPNDKILDLGCGTGAIASALAARGFRVTASDVAGQMVHSGKEIYAESPIEWLLLPSDWKRLPFESNTFDGIVASSVFEYLTDIDMTLTECWRVLNSGGLLIATVPNPQKWIRRLEHFLRPAVIMASKAPILNQISKLGLYATYLKCSRNRMRLDEWFALGKRAHFEVVAQDKSRASETPLAFLVFRKADNKSRQRLKNQHT